MGLRLVADIGGSNARFALSPGAGLLEQEKTLACADYKSLEHAVQSYLASSDGVPVEASLALAAILDGSDSVRMTNIDWQFSRRELESKLLLQRLRVLNDFDAIGYGLGLIQETDLHVLQAGKETANGHRLALGRVPVWVV